MFGHNLKRIIWIWFYDGLNMDPERWWDYTASTTSLVSTSFKVESWDVTVFARFGSIARWIHDVKVKACFFCTERLRKWHWKGELGDTEQVKMRMKSEVRWASGNEVRTSFCSLFYIYDNIFTLPNLMLLYLATNMFGHKLKEIIWIFFYLFLLKMI